MKRGNKIIVWCLPCFGIPLLLSCYFIFNRLIIETIIEYETRRIVEGSFEYVIPTVGAVEPKTKIEIKSLVSGKIIKLDFVEVNTCLKTNDLIAVIDHYESSLKLRELNCKLAVIEYDCELARDLFMRNQELFDKGENIEIINEHDYFKSKKEYEKFLAKIAEVKAQIEQAETIIANHYVRSPINGIVTVKNKENGCVVNAFQDVIVVIASLPEAGIEIIATVDESDLGYLKKGLNCVLKSRSYPTKVFNGKVDHIANAATLEEGIMRFLIKINLENKDSLLKYGMTFKPLEIIVPMENIIAIPGSALRFRQRPQDRDDYVWILENGEPKKTKISASLYNDKNNVYLVEYGLKTGDEVVLSESEVKIRRSFFDAVRYFIQIFGGARK